MKGLQNFPLLPLKTIFILILLLSSCVKVYAQDKCGTVEYEALLKDTRLQKEKKADFEQWLNGKIEKKAGFPKVPGAMSTLSEEVLIYQIPVVVHVIHNGESIGSGANISNTRVLSQIKILSDDFRRKNADSVHTLNYFRNAAADTQIEFVLAQRDPEGLSTTGIIRKKGSLNSYKISDNWDLKEVSYWPAEDYLNIWVAPLTGSLLGFAQFPQSDTEPGLEDASAYRLTDGVVIDSEYFGSNSSVNPISKGRTATHEVGHFLGLRHIWGDGGCDTDDFCEDTPQVDGANYNCPSGEVVSCGNKDMFQNYMDYTNDVCMNLFTRNQSERMIAVLENSPRRKRLLISKGGLPPAVAENDLGIKRIVSPIPISCDNISNPEIVVRNYGENNINNFEILYKINADTIDTIYQSIVLTPLDSIKVAFPSFMLPDDQDFTFEFIIKNVNGASDGNLDNNNRAVTVNLPKKLQLPIYENFESEISTGTLVNPDERVGWNVINAPAFIENNKALMLDCFNYDGLGERDFFVSHVFDLSEYSAATLTFKVAHAEYISNDEDGLRVAVSTDCGLDFPQANIVYEKFGEELATAEAQTEGFVPSGRLEWKEVTVDLTPYTGLENVRLSFAGINGYGNNILLDDILIDGRKGLVADLKISALNVPPVLCPQNFVPEVVVVNSGPESVSAFNVLARYPDREIDFDYAGPPIFSGDTAKISLPEVSAINGSGKITVSVSVPELTDAHPEDNLKSAYFVVDTTTEQLPLREDFTLANDKPLNWFIYNPDQSTTWKLIETSATEKNKAIYLNNFDYWGVNEKDWLISPLLDFRDLQVIKLSFMVSYAYNFNYHDKLQVLISTNCSPDFSHVVYEASGELLSETYAVTSWQAEEKSEWQKISLDLDEYIGERNVRIAFVIDNGNGNNLYLDDIEFFISEEPSFELPAGVNYIFPNPVDGILPVTFNLDEKETVKMALYDLRGKLLLDASYLNTLNQIYELDLYGLPSAVYLLKISGESFSDTKRILLKK